MDRAILGAGGTYGAASVVPRVRKKSSREPKPTDARAEISEFETTDPGAPFLEIETESLLSTADETHRDELGPDEVHDDDVLEDEPRTDEALGHNALEDEPRPAEDLEHQAPDNEPSIVEAQDEDVLDDEPSAEEARPDEDLDNEPSLGEIRAEDDTQPVDTARPVQRKAKRLKERSVHDSIDLTPLDSAPDEDLLKALSRALRGFPEIDWASICLMSDGGAPVPTIGLRIADNYRENVDAIVRSVVGAGGAHGVDLDVLLVDGHDLLRKAREFSFVFFPWKPKPFGS